MRLIYPIVLALMVGACTEELQVDSVTLKYKNGILQRFVVNGPLNDLRTIVKEHAMYLQVWPCGQPVDEGAAYHPVGTDEVLTADRPHLQFDVLDGKQTKLPDRGAKVCAQIVADGMNFWKRYRSNVLPIHVSAI